ncbi:hypothetical protein [Bacillus weihaiensis]|uniref:Glycerophosphoryl diester phosphodiesterase membrane domain-containing protein n=1 Tax=Bacillus weihaiensis TaxID=1547283 RepID=A0A1L3MNR3_9BACI|nr:hypothetical protein [Bacillus weihaiensis]APH03996.1 hypothetical protein A9C19_04170 [Bacillus weihaiensis]
MNNQFNTPKGFGQILDHTFRLSKNRFSDFFLILLILIGPIYVIQAVIQLLSGVNFFRETGVGTSWIEQIVSSFDQTYGNEYETTNFGADIALIVSGLFTAIFLPVAQAAILIAVNAIRNEEEFTVGTTIKKAFSRFWPIIGSGILFGLISFFLIVVPAVLISIVGFSTGVENPILGIFLAILLIVGVGIGVVYLLTRWSFYFGSVVLKEGSPGFSRSWRLTTKRTWSLIGLFIIFFLISNSISSAVEISFALVLGNSVLLGLLTNTVALFTTLFFAVGYAVMYLDLKVRNEATDLKDLVQEYENNA